MAGAMLAGAGASGGDILRNNEGEEVFVRAGRHPPGQRILQPPGDELPL